MCFTGAAIYGGSLSATEKISMNSTLPRRIKLLSSGVNRSSKGPLLFDKRSADLVMADFRSNGVRLFFDLDHSSVSELAYPGQGKSYGTFDLEVDDHGNLWAARINWTSEGKRLVLTRAYSYFSPVVGLEKIDGQQSNNIPRVISVFNVALTNAPALKGIAPLIANSAELPTRVAMLSRKITLGNNMENLQSQDVAAAPQGQPEGEPDAQDTQVADVVSSIRSISDQASAALADDSLSDADKLSALTDAVSGLSDALDSLDVAMQADVAEDEPAKPAPAAAVAAASNTVNAPADSPFNREVVASLTSEINDLKMQLQKRDVDAEIDSLIRLGKLVSAQREWAQSQSLEQLKQFSEHAPVIALSNSIKQPPVEKGNVAQYEQEALALAKKMGIKDHKALAVRLAAQAEK